MNLRSLSKDELEQNLRTLRQHGRQGEADDDVQATVQELQVHQIELEMQNRALREVQGELEHAVQRYVDLYDNLPLAYLTVLPDGKILGANRAACEWLKRESRAVAGMYLGSFMEPYDAGRLAAHLDACVRHAGPSVIELTIRPPGGTPAMVQLCSRPAPRRGEDATHIHVAVTDISRLKHAQRVLEEVNREQEAFNYSISHDLRAPLVTITNYAAIVLAEHGASMDAEAKAMIERMRAAAQRMEETLKHLLEYSTLAREEIALQPVALGRVVDEVLAEHRAFLEEKRAEVLVERPLPNVIGTPVVLKQVLSNLVTNAVKYTRPGETPHVRIAAEVGPHDVLVRVTDDGIGIEPKYHERIFKVFERLHGYSHYPGSGVGLAIARRAVERMNGRIWVESELGKGSRFCLQLAKA